MSLNVHEKDWLSEHRSCSVVTAVLLLRNVKLIGVTELRGLLIRVQKIHFWDIYKYVYTLINDILLSPKFFVCGWSVSRRHNPKWLYIIHCISTEHTGQCNSYVPSCARYFIARYRLTCLVINNWNFNYYRIFRDVKLYANVRERAVKDVGLRPLAYWKCGFESRRRHGYVAGECCVFSDRGICVGLITRPEESYRVVCLSVFMLSG